MEQSITSSRDPIAGRRNGGGGGPHTTGRGDRLMDLVRWQVGFGPRYPGTEAHERFRRSLGDRMAEAADELHVQRFSVDLGHGPVPCSNLISVVRGRAGRGARGIPRDRMPDRPPLLLGTHFDTRPRADNETDPERRERPILGANDGGSGTAVLLDLLDRLSSEQMDRGRLERDLLLVLFDAEDVGDIGGNRFSMGARYLAANPLPAAVGTPGEAIILDMIGGREASLDIDAHVLHHPGSRRLTERIFGLGLSMELGPFLRPKRNGGSRFRHVVCDQITFLTRGIPSCLLIDMDYPEWHTHGDLPEAMSGGSLVQIEDLLAHIVLGQGPEPH